jgi:ketosteroid isomerase-like protein
MLPADADFELKWEPQSAEVSGSGDMGYTWGFYTLSAKQYGYKILVRRGKYLNIWKKDDQNQWRVMVDMGNHNPPE